MKAIVQILWSGATASSLGFEVSLGSLGRHGREAERGEQERLRRADV